MTSSPWTKKTATNTQNKQTGQQKQGDAQAMGFGKALGNNSTFSFGKATTTAATTASNEIVLTKVCTEGIQYNTEIVELKTNTEQANGEQPIVPFRVNHIAQLEFFQNYTVEELRFYDYVRNGYIIKAKKQQASAFTLQNKTQYTNSMNKTTTQEAKREQVSSWKKHLSKLQPPPDKTQNQPYGTLPASKINLGQTETEQTYTKEKEIPQDLGLRDRQSLFSDVTATNPIKSATPGLRSSLQIQKLQDSNPTSTLKLIQKSASRNPQKTSQFDQQGISDANISDYIYTPDLESIKLTDEVPSFKVVNQNFGSITFLEPVKVGALNPKKNIRITNRRIDVTLTIDEKRKLGLNHDFPSIVTLKTIYPSESRSDESLRQYEIDLEKFCSEHNYKFLSYQPEDGTLMFLVDAVSAFPIEIQ